MAKFQVRIDGERCKGCELCLAVCPKGIVVMSTVINDKGYSPAAISDQKACTGCQSCALICPDGAIAIFKEEDSQ